MAKVGIKKGREHIFYWTYLKTKQKKKLLPSFNNYLREANELNIPLWPGAVTSFPKANLMACLPLYLSIASQNKHRRRQETPVCVNKRKKNVMHCEVFLLPSITISNGFFCVKIHVRGYPRFGSRYCTQFSRNIRWPWNRFLSFFFFFFF